MFRRQNRNWDEISTVECRLNLGKSDHDLASLHFSRISKLTINLLNLG